MVKLLKDLGSLKSGEITIFSKRKESNLVKSGIAIFVKIPAPCYKLK